MRVSAVSPFPICTLSARVGGRSHVSDCIKKSCKKKKKEHLCSLSRIWQLNSRFGIRCYIQCHYLTLCLADWSRVQIERQCHREREMSCLLHLPFTLLPLIASLSFSPLCSNLKESISRIHLLLYIASLTGSVRYISAFRSVRLVSRRLARCSVGCWRAFCETEGLGCRAGREPGVSMIFSGCITISLQVPSAHRGRAIRCRERATGARRSPSLPGFLDESGCHIKDKRRE